MLLAPVVYFAEPVKTSLWLFGQSNMHSTLDFCPRPARKEGNECTTTKEKLIAYCPNIHIIYCASGPKMGMLATFQ